MPVPYFKLVPRFRGLSYEEQLEFVKKLQVRRCYRPEKENKRKEKKNMQDRVMNLFNNLTPEQKAELLAKLEDN